MTLAEPAPDTINKSQLAVLVSEVYRSKAIVQIGMGNFTAAATTLQDALKQFANVELAGNEKQRWNFELTQCRLRWMMATCQMETEDFESSETNFLNSLENIEAMRNLFPNHAHIAENEGLVFSKLALLYERMEDWPSAIERYEASRKTHLTKFEENRNFPNPGNMYIESCVALARALANDSRASESENVAAEAIQKAQSFPISLTSTQAFQDNMRLLKQIVNIDHGIPANNGEVLD